MVPVTALHPRRYWERHLGAILSLLLGPAEMVLEVWENMDLPKHDLGGTHLPLPLVRHLSILLEDQVRFCHQSEISSHSPNEV